MMERIQSILKGNFKISLAGRRLQMFCLSGPCRMQIVGVLKELSFPSHIRDFSYGLSSLVFCLYQHLAGLMLSTNSLFFLHLKPKSMKSKMHPSNTKRDSDEI